jgi:predicted HAD superfamily phosphohydrolase YqeG
MGIPKRDIAAVGDQIFTDVIAGNLAGVRTFMVEKLHRREIWYVALKRIPEKLVRLIGRF